MRCEKKPKRTKRAKTHKLCFYVITQVLHAARDSQKHITDIKWAPSGQSLAMGTADGKVYVYK